MTKMFVVAHILWFDGWNCFLLNDWKHALKRVKSVCCVYILDWILDVDLNENVFEFSEVPRWVYQGSQRKNWFQGCFARAKLEGCRYVPCLHILKPIPFSLLIYVLAIAFASLYHTALHLSIVLLGMWTMIYDRNDN